MLLTRVLAMKTTRQAAVSAAWIPTGLPCPPRPPATHACPGLSASGVFVAGLFYIFLFFFLLLFFFSPQPLFTMGGGKKELLWWSGAAGIPPTLLGEQSPLGWRWVRAIGRGRGEATHTAHANLEAWL